MVPTIQVFQAHSSCAQGCSARIWNSPSLVETLIHERFCYLESSQIQFTSQVFPLSGENDCSMRADSGEMLSQR